MGDGGKARRRLIQVAIAWAVGFLLISSGLAYGISAHDWKVTRMTFLASLVWHPVAAMGAYYETRAAWSGEDFETRQAFVALGIIAAVFALSFAI